MVCRISGFFRDAFPHLIALLDEAVQAVAALDEPLEQNFVAQALRWPTQAQLRAEGWMRPTQARAGAATGSSARKPGSYGAGILPLIDERNWRTDADLAEVYVNWGGYAYTGDGARRRRARRRSADALGGVQVGVKNQDNREHDIFDSDDYFQFHGGMIAAIRALTGQNPRALLRRHARPGPPARPRPARGGAARVPLAAWSTRSGSPAISRHGYKGAFEMAATVDYLFGYDATAQVVDDWMYEQVAEAYLLDRGAAAVLRR